MAVLMGAIQGYMGWGSYENALKAVLSDDTLTREQKKEEIAALRAIRDGTWGDAGLGGLATIGGSAAGVGLAVALGSNPIGWVATLAGIAGGLGASYFAGESGWGDSIGKWVGKVFGDNEISDEELDELLKENKGAKAKPHKKGGIINDGISGEHLVSAEDNEAVLNPEQQRKFMAIANGEEVVKANPSVNESAMQKNFMAMSNTETPVKSTPVVGEKPEYVYRPSKTEISNVNGNTITVKDFNVHMDGTIKLDAGTASRTLNMSEVLRSIDNDPTFKRALADLLYESIKERSNREMNNGRFLNDSPTKA
jgi:hypothetical protein